MRANNAEAGPGRTTPVTRYPSGASPYGMLDALWNVFHGRHRCWPTGVEF